MDEGRRAEHTGSSDHTSNKRDKGGRGREEATTEVGGEHSNAETEEQSRGGKIRNDDNDGDHRTGRKGGVLGLAARQGSAAADLYCSIQKVI